MSVTTPPSDDTDATLPETDDEAEAGEVIDIPPPDVRKSRWGLLGYLWTLHTVHKERQKKLGNGYVQWILIGDSYPKPRFVKPTRRGGGIPELKHKGERYLFPREAMVPSEQQGFWTIIHREGEASPINVREPSPVGISTKKLEEYINLRPQASPPSFWDRLGLDIGAEDAVKYAIAAIILIALLQGVLGGGF